MFDNTLVVNPTDIFRLDSLIEKTVNTRLAMLIEHRC